MQDTVIKSDKLWIDFAVNKRRDSFVKLPGKRQLPVDSGNPDGIVVVGLRRCNDDNVEGLILTLRKRIVGSLEILLSICK